MSTPTYDPDVGSAEYQRKWRASKGARTGQPGRPATQPCGTVAAYRRHGRNGEEPCEACRQAERERQAELYRKRKADNNLTRENS